MLQQRGVQGTCARGSWIPGLELNQQGRWQWGWRRTAQVRLLLPKDPDAGCVGLCGEGWGQGAQAGSRDTEGTVWGWGKEQSCEVRRLNLCITTREVCVQNKCGD